LVTKGGTADGGKRSRSSPGVPVITFQAQFLMMTKDTMFALRKQAQNEVIENNLHKCLYEMD
jgi:hypothetical protein